jgi:uncharacterized LabA/DUF88 family protein
MDQQLEVGLFIDFENIRYGTLNNFGQEPDPQELMDKARKYGPVAVAYAYADFTQHPSIYRRKLEVAGITPRDVPRRSPDVVHKSSADMAMLMDIIDCLLDRPYVKTLVLMTGDSDFIRVTARARHRFGRQVVICGVPGSVSADLIESADLYDPLGDDLQPSASAPEPEQLALAEDDELRLMQLVLWLNEHRPYMTFGFIRSHALSPHHSLGLAEDRVTELLSGLKEREVLVESQMTTDDGRTLRTLELNAAHPLVDEARALGTPPFHDRPSVDRLGPDVRHRQPVDERDAPAQVDDEESEPQSGGEPEDTDPRSWSATAPRAP